MANSMYYAYSAPHESMAWEARTEPKVVEIFEKLWETKELLCSFDGLNISLPRRKDLRWSPWPHCDQNKNRKGCVQSGSRLAGESLMTIGCKLCRVFSTMPPTAPMMVDSC